MIVTVVPAKPTFGVTEAITGVLAGALTVNEIPLELLPKKLTTTFPVVAEGTEQDRDVGDQPVHVAAVPLNLTVEDPCVAPKVVPAIVTPAPTTPLAFSYASGSWADSPPPQPLAETHRALVSRSQGVRNSDVGTQLLSTRSEMSGEPGCSHDEE